MTGRRSWAAAVVQWRNWPVLVKIGAVLVVPVVGAMVLGVLRVRADVELATGYGNVERLAALRGELVPVLSILQRERNLAVQQGSAPDVYQQQLPSVDVVVANLDKLVRETAALGAAAETGYLNLKKALAGLPELRRTVQAGYDPGEVLAGYRTITQAILDFDRSLVGRFPDQELTGASVALFDLQVAREQVSLQQALVLIGIRRGELGPLERERLIEADVRLADMISDIHAVASPDLWRQYLDTVTGSAVLARQDFIRQARAETPVIQPPPRVRPKPTMPFAAPEWNSSSDTTTGLMSTVARTAATQLRTASAGLQDVTSSRAGTQSVLLLAMVLLAAAIGGVVGRYLLRSLGTLRKTALDVAGNRLPAAVASIRAGRPAGIEPVPVRTTEEFGQLARAFDTVHSQAVRSAEEEASLRSNLRNIFVNLSRRSQSLVERQLRLMEQLEQKENDPDQLANLFKLDHLATRMRRNNENLVVLSGADLGRRYTDHVPLADVLRAAVSEVEHYQRALVQSAPRVHVLGYAAGDLVRTIAELVENATAFSPPEAQVSIRASRPDDDGAVLVEILDEGIGMAAAELVEANNRVAASGGVDVPVSRQMGLFVVGSLANRHGIEVTLARREPEGLVASVLVPVELIAVNTENGTNGRKPLGVSGRLRSAGIFVELPALPAASSPASILFHPQWQPEPEPEPAAQPAAQPEPVKDFAWLGGAPPPPAAQRTEASVLRQPPPAALKPDVPPGEGLPKRVPKAQLFAGSRTTAKRTTQPRSAENARGFLASFQAGVRQSKAASADQQTGDAVGEEKS